MSGFPVESAGQEEEDKARDQDLGELERRDQHYPTSGHSQRPSGRSAVTTRNSMFVLCFVPTKGRILDYSSCMRK